MIDSLAEYKRVLARRKLIAVPLRDAHNLPAGALPVEVRQGLTRLLAQLNDEIATYERKNATRMGRRVCHAACPKDGSFCENDFEIDTPHAEHFAASTCRCKWDDHGNLVTEAEWSETAIESVEGR